MSEQENQRAGGYLPIPCPVCKRLRLEYVVTGLCMEIKCEKCESELDVILDAFDKLLGIDEDEGYDE